MRKRRTARLTASRDVYQDARWIVDRRAAGRCEICGERPPSEHQHRIRRGAGGSSRNPAIHRPSSLLAVCRPCHVKADTATERYENGWSVRRGTDPAATPVLYRGEWVLLDDGGGRSLAYKAGKQA